MGQKTNPNILRLAKITELESKYFEKKPTEFFVNNFKDIELKKFVLKFCNNYNLLLHTIRVNYSENSIHIFVSYYSNFKLLKKDTQFKLSPKRGNYKSKSAFRKKLLKIKENVWNYLEYKIIDRAENFWCKIKHQKKIVRRTLKEFRVLKFRRVKLLTYRKKCSLIQSYKTLQNANLRAIKENIFESVKLFVKKEISVFLTFKQINKNIMQNFNKEKQSFFKRVLLQLKKYDQLSFFKESINILFLVVARKNSSFLLANFISNYLKSSKKHNFFLKFVKSVLKNFSCNNFFSVVQGIKIKIKGRINGSPRAKKRTILIEKGVPVLKLISNINYSEAVSYTKNGTLGVKVWILEK